MVDAFTDPMFATLTDSCTSRYGRRKPFLWIAAVMCPLVMFMAYNPPEGPVAAGVWFGIFHILWKLCDTVCLISVQSLGNELTPNYKFRTKLWTV